jgi:hypothetical protein
MRLKTENDSQVIRNIVRLTVYPFIRLYRMRVWRGEGARSDRRKAWVGRGNLWLASRRVVENRGAQGRWRDGTCVERSSNLDTDPMTEEA